MTTADEIHAPGGRIAVMPDDIRRYRWVAMGVVLLGTFMVVLDTTLVNVALPRIGEQLGNVGDVDWIVTAYLLAVGVAQPPTGWLADRYGRRRVFQVSVVLFAVGSLFCALAPTFGALVAFRVVQGLGGGAMLPVSLAMVYELFPPHERGTAMGIWGVAIMAAPALGPTLGGYIATSVDWRWLFLVNVPVGVIALVASIRLLRDLGYREDRPFDGVGMAYVAIGLVLLLLAFSEATAWGWGSVPFLLSVVVGTAFVAVFVVHAVRSPNPLINLTMFTNFVFSLTMVIVALLTLAQFGRLVFIPLELETVRGWTALHVGILLTPSAIGVACTMPIGGRLADRIGPRVPVCAGLLILAMSTWFLGHLSLGDSEVSIALLLFLGGIGNGLAMMPNTVAAMNSVSTRLVSQAAAVRNLSRQVSGAIGVAVLAAIVSHRLGALGAVGAGAAARSEAQAAYNSVFLIATAGALVAFVLACWLPNREQTRRVQRLRAAEAEELQAAEVGELTFEEI